MEDKTIDELTLNELLALLTEEEREIVYEHLEGKTPEELERVLNF